MSSPIWKFFKVSDKDVKLAVCNLAQDEGSAVRGFAVVEYETAEQAEAVLLEMDRQLIQGQEIRLSLCSPGTSGRSTLAALIAAQGVLLLSPPLSFSHSQ
ncbi:ribonucleoprotein PTB-binding 2 isoform X1 [Tachysurus ichikawai]